MRTYQKRNVYCTQDFSTSKFYLFDFNHLFTSKNPLYKPYQQELHHIQTLQKTTPTLYKKPSSSKNQSSSSSSSSHYLYIKGDPTTNTLTCCTIHSTFHLTQIQTSNSLFILPQSSLQTISPTVPTVPTVPSVSTPELFVHGALSCVYEVRPKRVHIPTQLQLLQNPLPLWTVLLHTFTHHNNNNNNNTSNGNTSSGNSSEKKKMGVGYVCGVSLDALEKCMLASKMEIFRYLEDGSDWCVVPVENSFVRNSENFLSFDPYHANSSSGNGSGSKNNDNSKNSSNDGGNVVLYEEMIRLEKSYCRVGKKEIGECLEVLLLGIVEKEVSVFDLYVYDVCVSLMEDGLCPVLLTHCLYRLRKRVWRDQVNSDNSDKCGMSNVDIVLSEKEKDRLEELQGRFPYYDMNEMKRVKGVRMEMDMKSVCVYYARLILEEKAAWKKEALWEKLMHDHISLLFMNESGKNEEEEIEKRKKCLKEMEGLGFLMERGVCVMLTDTMIQYFDRDNLSTNLEDRIEEMFQVKKKWKLEEMKPYLNEFVTFDLTLDVILQKYTRCNQILDSNTQKYYYLK